MKRTFKWLYKKPTESLSLFHSSACGGKLLGVSFFQWSHGVKTGTFLLSQFLLRSLPKKFITFESVCGKWREFQLLSRKEMGVGQSATAVGPSQQDFVVCLFHTIPTSYSLSATQLCIIKESDCTCWHASKYTKKGHYLPFSVKLSLLLYIL